jgi:hypothetical protein
MVEVYFYTTPTGATLTLTLDQGGAVLPGVPMTAHGRPDAQRVALPAGTGQQGATLDVTAVHPDPALVYPVFHGRGVLTPSTTGEATYQFDDVHLVALPAVPVTPPDPPGLPEPPNPNDPFDTILWVYNQGSFNLATTRGCGEFVEACALTLFTYTSPAWGHVRKTPGQVQWNGHAVDAIHALAGDYTGIWDIITNSQVPGAAPAFNFAGPADPMLWYPGNLAAPPPASRRKAAHR